MRILFIVCTYLCIASIMPNMPNAQQDRRAALRQLLVTGPQQNQQQLVDKLAGLGYVATQSSVSRDLRDIGAVKTGRGYELPDDEIHDSEIEAVAELLRGVQPAGPNLLVIRTAIGAAQRVALALDRCGWSEIVGTVAGDDTVFTATASGRLQRQLISRLHQHGAVA